MSHGRQQIREQLVTTLTDLTTTGSNVFTNRDYKLVDANLPALIINTGNESQELLCKTPRYLKRTLPVNVEARAKQADDVDDLMDQIASEVEIAIGADPTLGGLAKDLTGITSADINVTVEGNQPVGVMRLTFDVIYITEEGTPEATL